MKSPILAVDTDGSAVWGARELYALDPLRRNLFSVTKLLRGNSKVPSTNGRLVACVTRARTASAVAHEHARRLL